MKILESKRIFLRPVDENSLPFLLELRWNKDVCETIIPEPITMLQQIEWFNNLRNAEHFCICLKSGEIIGAIGIFDIHQQHRRAKWTLRIHPTHWRKGYAKESIIIFLDYVFNTLNINKLMGDCFEGNFAEVNNLTKLGFRNEGTWMQHYFHKGKYQNSIQFVMTKSEYEIHKHLHI